MADPLNNSKSNQQQATSLNSLLDKQRLTGSALLDVINQSSTALTQVNTNFAAAAKQAQTQVDGAYADGIKAAENAAFASRLPRGLSRLLGFFDSDFSPEYQANKLRESSLRVDQAGRQLANLEEMRKLALQEIDSSVRNASTAFSVTGTLLNSAADMERLNLSRAQVGMEGARLKMAQEQQAWARTNRAVENLSDADLNKEITAGNNSQFASNMGLLQQERDRRTSAQTAIENAKNAVAAGNLELALKNKAVLLNTINPSEVDDLLSHMGANNSVNFNGLSFTKRELEETKVGLLKKQEAATTELFNRAMLNTQAASHVNEADKTMQGVVSALDNKPPPELERYAQLRSEIAEAAKLGLPEAVKSRSDELKKLNDEITKTYSTALGANDKEREAAVSAYIKNGGAFNNSAQAHAILANDIVNPNAMYGTPFQSAWSLVSNKYAELSANNFQAPNLMSTTAGANASAGVPMPNARKATHNELMLAATRSADALTPALATMWSDYLLTNIKTLAENNPAFRDFIGTDGNFNRAVSGLYGVDENGKATGQVKTQELLVKLAEADAKSQLAENQTAAMQGRNPTAVPSLVEELLSTISTPSLRMNYLSKFYNNSSMTERAFGTTIGLFDAGGASAIAQTAFAQFVAQEKAKAETAQPIAAQNVEMQYLGNVSTARKAEALNKLFGAELTPEQRALLATEGAVKAQTGMFLPSARRPQPQR